MEVDVTTVTRVPAARPATWGTILQSGSPEDLDLDNGAEVVRQWCLAVDDPHAAMPERCTLAAGHGPGHTWERDAIMTRTAQRQELEASAERTATEAARLAVQRRADEERMHGCLIEQDTPSGRLPVRTPGAALRDEEGLDGPGGPGEAARPGESILGRPVIERWPA